MAGLARIGAHAFRHLFARSAICQRQPRIARWCVHAASFAAGFAARRRRRDAAVTDDA
jgi:hypothetical protein